MDGRDVKLADEAVATARQFVRSGDLRGLGVAIDHLRHAQEEADAATRAFLAETEAILDASRKPRSALEREHRQLGLEILGRRQRATAAVLKSWRAVLCEAVSAFSAELESTAEPVETSLGRFQSRCHAIAAACREGQLIPGEFYDRARQEQQTLARPRASAAADHSPKPDLLASHDDLQIRLLKLLRDSGPKNMTEARELLHCGRTSLFSAKDALKGSGCIDPAIGAGAGAFMITAKGRERLIQESDRMRRMYEP